MTVHLRKTKFFIISESKFNWNNSENCHFHILSYRYRIISYRFFCLDFAISPILDADYWVLWRHEGSFITWPIGDRRDPARLRRLRQHGSGRRDRVWVNAGRPENHEAWSDSAQRKQHHHGEIRLRLLYNKTSCLESIKFSTEDRKLQHKNITTISRNNLNENYIQK